MTKLNTELSMYLSKDDINNRLKEMANQLSEKYWGMDRFRIIALESIIKKSFLSKKNKLKVKKSLKSKINIFLKGLKKRKKKKEIIYNKNKKKKND